MKNSLTNIYENMLITEVMGAVNYWLSPSGELIHVPYNLTHMSYAQKHFDDVDWFQLQQDMEQGKVGWKDTYNVVYKAGYVRVVEYEFTIHISYDRSRTPNSRQIHTLKELCESKEKNLYDDETNKILIKQNEMDPTTFSRASLADKLSKELKQPEFYKNKPFGDSFSKYDINDYTKLIREYDIKKDDVYDDDEFGSYRMGMLKPKPLKVNPEDYRQSMIDEAIEEIQLAVKNKITNDPHYSVEGRIDFWTKFLHENDFSQYEIEKIIDMGLGDWDFRN